MAARGACAAAGDAFDRVISAARSPEDTAHLVPAFLRGLAENGYVEGQNVTVDYRWALGQQDRLPALAAELARRRVAVVVATGGKSAALAAKAATSTIPIATRQLRIELSNLQTALDELRAVLAAERSAPIDMPSPLRARIN